MLKIVTYTTLGCLLSCTECLSGTATQWSGTIDPGLWFHAAFGVWPGYEDGYDGLAPFDVMARAGIYIQHFRTNGPSWTGPTGFYTTDWESPIPDGESHTWSDIRLWSYDYTPPLGNRIAGGYTWATGYKPPAGYTGILTIDYVPAHLDWTGPYEFRIDLNQGGGFYLSVPITDDPYNPANVTRMHLTVYTVPEPSSLAAVGLALAGVGASVISRRRA